MGIIIPHGKPVAQVILEVDAKGNMKMTAKNLAVSINGQAQPLDPFTILDMFCKAMQGMHGQIAEAIRKGRGFRGEQEASGENTPTPA